MTASGAGTSSLTFFLLGSSASLGPMIDGRVFFEPGDGDNGGGDSTTVEGRSDSDSPYESRTSRRIERGSWARIERSRSSVEGCAAASFVRDDELDEAEVEVEDVVHSVMEGGGRSSESPVAAMLIL